MSKCKLCGKEEDGVICKACLSEGASKVGRGVKKASKIVPFVAALGIYALKGKVNSKN